MPMQPDAIESGALKVSCQTNRNDSQRPTRGPYIARRYRTGPPACGIAAPAPPRPPPLRPRPPDLRPDEAVARDEDRPDDPAEHRLRAVHRGDDQRDCD